jgi:hypothetical protein
MKNIKTLSLKRKVGILSILVIVTVSNPYGWALAIVAVLFNINKELTSGLCVGCALLGVGLGSFWALVSLGAIA